MAIWAAAIGALGTGAAAAMNDPSSQQGVIMPGFQKKLGKDLSQYFRSDIGKGLPGYEGPLTAGLHNLEQRAMEGIGPYLDSLGQGQTLAIEQFKNAMQPMTPAETEAFYSRYFDPLAQRMMEQQVLPGFKESMVPGGNLRSSGTALGLGQLWGDYATNRMAGIGDWWKWQQEQANKLLPYGAQISEWESGIPQLQTAMQFGGVARGVEQADIDRRLAEFIRTTPQLNPILDKGLGLMGVSTNAYYQPSGESPFSQAMQGLMPGIGAYLANRSAQPVVQQQQTTQTKPDMSGGIWV